MAWWKGIAVGALSGLLIGMATAAIHVSVLWEGCERHVDSALGFGKA